MNRNCPIAIPDTAAADRLMAARLQALAHPVRLAILRMLACRDACCCKDVVRMVGLAQSTVSQHLKVLVEAGLVTYAPDRQASRYTLERAALRELATGIEGLLEECCAPALNAGGKAEDSEIGWKNNIG